jgi:hypothetical protein
LGDSADVHKLPSSYRWRRPNGRRNVFGNACLARRLRKIRLKTCLTRRRDGAEDPFKTDLTRRRNDATLFPKPSLTAPGAAFLVIDFRCGVAALRESEVWSGVCVVRSLER